MKDLYEHEVGDKVTVTRGGANIEGTVVKREVGKATVDEVKPVYTVEAVDEKIGKHAILGLTDAEVKVKQ